MPAACAYWYLQRPADTPPLKRRQQRANFLERCGSAGDSAATATRFVKAGDAAKAANFCGDVVYLAVLLDKLGFDDDATLTMTNKIKDVELVWTLGAMLAKSAELRAAEAGGGGGGGGFSLRAAFYMLLAAAALWACCLRKPSGTHGHLPLRSAKPGFPP